jgi:hypothetical protein
VGKRHDVPSASGALELEIHLRFEVVGQQGGHVHVGAWFESPDGRALRAMLPEHADPAGRLAVRTAPVLVPTARASYAAVLRVPYSAVPAPDAGASRTVGVRVQILRTDAEGRVSALAEGRTTFEAISEE